MANNVPLNALACCNVQAMPITFSSANALSISIKRVSDKTRNPSIKPMKISCPTYIFFKKQITEGGPLKR